MTSNIVKNYQLREGKRKGKHRVYVYYYAKGKHTWIPRKQTKHLDGQSIKSIEEWVAFWKVQFGIEKENVRRVSLNKEDKLAILFDSYQNYRQSLRDITDQTIAAEKYRFERFILAYFIVEKKQRSPRLWHKHVPGYYEFLKGLELATDTIKKLLWDLERFGKYLVFIRETEFPFAIMIPRRSNRKITPLKRRVTPEDILNARFTTVGFRRSELNSFNQRLAVLIGYFATLGPAELFALEKKDFLTGEQARESTKTLRGLQKHGIGSSLSVVISKGLKGKGFDSYPKNYYRYGVVNIFDIRAAKAIASILKDLPDGRLFSLSREHLNTLWRSEIKSVLGTTAHDLRRASCLYLGRSLRIEPTLLQEHARHSELDTTMLYCRDPLIPNIKIEHQDWNDVS